MKWELVTEEKVQPYEPDEIGWVCYDCDNTTKFHREHNSQCGSFCDCDVECLECGSDHTGEEVLSYKATEKSV